MSKFNFQVHTRRQVGASYTRSSDTKSSQYFISFLNCVVVFNNTAIRRVSFLPPIPRFYTPFASHVLSDPCAPVMMGIIITVIFFRVIIFKHFQVLPQCLDVVGFLLFFVLFFSSFSPLNFTFWKNWPSDKCSLIFFVHIDWSCSTGQVWVLRFHFKIPEILIYFLL